MQRVVLGIVVSAGIFAPSASGQCRLDPWNYGVGAFENGRAVVSERTSTGPALHFLSKSPQGWQQETSFVLGDLQAFYPSPVAIDGDRALAGAAETSGQAGRAFVFDRVGGQWVPTEIFPAIVQGGNFFGQLAALDGEVAVVGADHQPIAGGDGLPLVHVFEHVGAAWNQVAQFQIDAISLDFEGTTLVVGEDYFHPGRVEIIERVAGTWVSTQQLVGTAPSVHSSIGSSVALQGDTLAVGAVGYDLAAGFVEIYERQAGIWQLAQHIVPGDSTTGDSFGWSLALSGSTLLVGAPDRAPHGRIYRFEHDGTAFVETRSYGPEPGNHAFGLNVAFEGEDAVLGGYPNSHLYRLGFADASSFCPATPNSTGARGVLAAEGCDSRSGERLTLVAHRIPPAAIGFVFLGLNTSQLPFGDGTLCIGAPRHRLPVAVADAFGTLVHDVDFGSRPGSSLAAGRTWKFQTVFRDPASSGTRLNLTNALAIRITP